AMRSVVIPESELTFEKLEVAPGENRTLDFIRTLLANMGIEADATLYSSSDGTLRVSITGEGASVLIGHHGDTLDALQYLANLAGTQKNANGEKCKTRVTIDIEGYRQKREETLRALARRKAAQALKNKRSVMLEPMSAYERRIIHSEVQSIEGVSTNSVGSDSNRKIVIFLTDKRGAAAEPADAEYTEPADLVEETVAETAESDE
ncbi:MAG: KH domain-containing protein, partial [Clostridia bacterium]|nr:KH domain-containing protein [Clostridia bacterium]